MLPLLAAAVIVSTGPKVTVNPAVVPLRHTATVTVRGVFGPTLEVHLLGSSQNDGRPIPWTPLRRVGLMWRGTLPLPEYRGIYPVELRVARGMPVIRSESWLFRVFAPGTLARPSFRTADEVAAYWVRTKTSHGRVEAVRNWPRPAFDRRIRKLHQLMVVAYSLPNRRRVKDRLGVFVTAVRDGYHGRWRFLEASFKP